LPESSHLGDGTSIDLSPAFSVAASATTTGAQSWSRMSGPSELVEAKAMPATAASGIVYFR
jgi:hypothetical protein